MKKAWNKDNIFIIPVGRDFGFLHEDTVNLIYSPLAGKFLLMKKTEAKELQFDLEEGKRTDLTDVLTSYKFPWERKGYHRDCRDYTTLYILLNQKCNFSCSYCYAAAGRSSTELTFPKIKSMLDCFFSSEESREKKRTITFVGGGEPLLSWQLLTQCVQYAESMAAASKYALSINIISNTSLFDDEKIAFLRQHGIAMICSFDILPEIQDAQRGHYELVANNLKKLLSAGIHVHIQATITPSAIPHMKKMVEEVSCCYPAVKQINMEMVWDASVMRDQVSAAQYFNDFYDAYRAARAAAREKNLQISNSFVNCAKIVRDHYCGGAYVLTPEGRLSACPYVSSPADIGYEAMVYGECTPDGLLLNKEKMQHFYAWNATNRAACKDCFAKWNCGGGCPNAARNYSAEVLTEICRHTRAYLRRELLEQLAQNFYNKHKKTLEFFLHEQIKEKE